MSIFKEFSLWYCKFVTLFYEIITDNLILPFPFFIIKHRTQYCNVRFNYMQLIDFLIVNVWELNIHCWPTCQQLKFFGIVTNMESNWVLTEAFDSSLGNPDIHMEGLRLGFGHGQVCIWGVDKFVWAQNTLLVDL